MDCWIGLNPLLRGFNSFYFFSEYFLFLGSNYPFFLEFDYLSISKEYIIIIKFTGDTWCCLKNQMKMVKYFFDIFTLFFLKLNVKYFSYGLHIIYKYY